MMNVADSIIKYLKEEGVNVLFGYPGGAVLPLYESLRESNIEHVLVRQEQSAGHMASGYSRASGKVGVCIATSGPGATNLITGIATAYQDSIPMVVITGQVSSHMIGKDMFQEADIVGASESFTKHNYLIKDAKDVLRVFKEAFYIANTGRKGPVLIDIPSDIQKHMIEYNVPDKVELKGYKPTVKGNLRQVKRAVEQINEAKKPLICIGGGIALSEAREELEEFVNKVKIPVLSSLMGIDSFNNESEYFAGLLGSHGYPFVNEALNECDLLIVIGARLGDRSTFFLKSGNAKNIIHIDIDPAEIGKNLSVRTPIVGDAKKILSELNNCEFTVDVSQWMKDIKDKRKEYFENIEFDQSFGGVNPTKAINIVSDIASDNAIVTADVGKNQIWTAHWFSLFGDRRFFTSGGLGTMGYSLPAAIGAAFADRDREVIAVMGDGGLQMLMSEIALLREYDLNIKIIVLNNDRLGMVQEIQERVYGEDKVYGISFGFNPDLIKLGQAYEIEGVKIENPEELETSFRTLVKKKGPMLIECKVDPRFETLPMGGKNNG